MKNMFCNCQLLTTIIVSSALFKTTQVTSSSNMFFGCTNLIGGKGTSYNSSYIDKTYARGDDAPTIPGYFTGVANCASFDSADGTLEIFYTGAAHTNGEIVGTKTYYTNIDQITGTTTPKWYSIRNSITKVIIEDLFKPKTGYCLFSSTSLTSIEFFKYNVVIEPDITDINLYYEYNSETETYFLTEDQTIEEKTYYTRFSIFDTSKVINMSFMFNQCYALTSLDVSDFDTSNVTNMNAMFQSCHALTTLDVSNFDTSNVTNMHCMFQSCYELTSLDVSNFDTSKVTDMHNMFGYCPELTAFDISNFVFLNSADISGMFEGCTSLAGAIRINSNPGSYIDMFKDTVEEIVLFGNSTLLNSFTTTANNHNVYVWSLSVQPRAERDKEVGDLVNFSVEITRFAANQGRIKGIEVKVDDVSVPLTWNEPLIMDINPKTFTASLANVDENASITYTFIVEDIYGKSLPRSITVPTNYYTIDYLKGGKEISFGEKASAKDLYDLLTTEPSDWSTNWTDYYEIDNSGEFVPVSDAAAPTFATDTYYKKIHESLFKCKMDSSFNDMTPTEVSDFISDLDISGSPIELTQADWVVEQGITGDWTWRKWQSGIAECWGCTGDITLTNYTTVDTLHGYSTTVTFPTNLFVNTPIVTFSAYVGNGFALTGTLTNSISSSSANIHALATPTGSQTTRWYCEAKGRWK